MHSHLPNKNTYFIDESGDIALFTKRKKPVSLENGGSKFFMIGMAHIKEDVTALTQTLESLRQDLLSDPCLHGIPSLQRTALYFHAKDDCSAVRRDVFKLLLNIDVSVQVIIRRKSALIDQAKSRFEYTGKKLSEGEIYNDMITRLLKLSLHKNDCDIVFAKRGKTFNNQSLRSAIDKAKNNLLRSHRITVTTESNIIAAYPSDHAGLQVIDYFLWALQKLYESGEDHYFNRLREKYSLIMDIDDKRNHAYGEYYSGRNMLSLEKIRG